MVRFSIVGEETSKLMHDLKGMLSSPFMLLENLRNNSSKIPQETFEKHLNDLTSELEHVRTVIRSINRLVVTNDQLKPVNVADAAVEAKRILDRRLKNISVILPTSKTVLGTEERLQSILFNLMINSLEAFETSEVANPEIRMEWKNLTLVYTDNAGGFNMTPQQTKHKSGIGIELIKIDTSKMHAKFRMSTVKNLARTEITFKAI